MDAAANEQLHLVIACLVGLCSLLCAIVAFIVHRAANSQDALAQEVITLRIEVAELKGKIALLLERERRYLAGGQTEGN